MEFLVACIYPFVHLSAKMKSFVHLNLDEVLNSEILNRKPISENQDSLIQKFENPFLDDELVIHVDYGVGIYEGLRAFKN